MPEQSRSRGIKILRESVARKIAAGEVIDRPAAVVRELLDNAIDARAESISVYIEDGGIRTIRVTDDGSGMSGNDLKLCYLPHATSKIEHAEDIYRITSLGFRGEALSSMAACGRLSIRSAQSGQDHGWQLSLDARQNPMITAISQAQGTTVELRDIFHSIPGRRQFLKQPRSESTMIRQVFLEKALPFPDIWFRLFVDGKLQLNLPKASLFERVTTAWASIIDSRLAFKTSSDSSSFSLQGILASPAQSRRDRRYIHVYLNKRRISEYSLVQAVEYGFSAFLPGGNYPIGFIFIEADPDTVDFNIHPAKREAKIRNLADIHRSTVHMIQSALSQGEVPVQPKPASSINFNFDPGSDRRINTHETKILYSPVDIRSTIQNALENTDTSGKNPSGPVLSSPSRVSYLGQLFSLFLVFEYNEKLFILDQHAAHERIIYDGLVEKAGTSQRLLIPLQLEDCNLNTAFCNDLQKCGVLVELRENCWELSAIPASCNGMEKEIKGFIEGYGGNVKNLEQTLFSDIACKKAIRDGEPLDHTSAESLINQSLALPEPRCPHGRPIWVNLSRAELFNLLGRS